MYKTALIPSPALVKARRLQVLKTKDLNNKLETVLCDLLVAAKFTLRAQRRMVATNRTNCPLCLVHARALQLLWQLEHIHHPTDTTLIRGDTVTCAPLYLNMFGGWTAKTEDEIEPTSNTVTLP